MPSVREQVQRTRQLGIRGTIPPVAGIGRILREQSELRNLWDEGGREERREPVEDLRRRLRR